MQPPHSLARFADSWVNFFFQTSMSWDYASQVFEAIYICQQSVIKNEFWFYRFGIWHSLVKVLHCSLDWYVEEHSSIWVSVQHQLMPEVQNHQQRVFLEDCVEALHPVVQATKVKGTAVQSIPDVCTPSFSPRTYHHCKIPVLSFHHGAAESISQISSDIDNILEFMHIYRIFG